MGRSGSPRPTPPSGSQVILQALKTYGMILADNGSSWFLSGAPDPRWNNDDLRQLRLRVRGARGRLRNARAGRARDIRRHL
jgi:hypothetical protein